jgi:DNA-binding transcriptional MerR regulator
LYEKRGLIAAAARNDNGYRDYPPDLVGLLRYIGEAQSLGFTLKEIAEAGPSTGEHPVSCDQALDLLRGKLAAVERLISEAQDRRRRILDLIEQLQATKRHKVA